MKTFLSLIERFSRIAVAAAFLLLMAAVLVQVLGRSLFAGSPVWTEELTRFALLYLAAFGAGLSYLSGDLVNVNLFSDSLPERWSRVLQILAAAATSLLSLILLGPAWHYTTIGAMQTSPALGWRMDFIHATVLVLLVSLLLFSGARLWALLSGQEVPKPEGMQP